MTVKRMFQLAGNKTGWLENNERHMTRDEAIGAGIIDSTNFAPTAKRGDETITVHHIESKVYEDLTNVNSSMMFDYGTEIATLEDITTGRTASIRVGGLVDVDWCETGDFENGKVSNFNCAVLFPEQLQKLIETNPKWESDSRVRVNESNFFEVEVMGVNEYGGKELLHQEIVHVENKTKDQIMNLLTMKFEEVCERVYNDPEKMRNQMENEYDM